jgi:CheY-like chemotaxis protein
MLEFDQRNVKAVASGAEALAVCESETFDLVIVDYLMPGMRGDRLAVALKERHPNLPIMMITGAAEKQSTAANLPEGVDLVIPKPFQFADLREAVTRLVTKA